MAYGAYGANGPQVAHGAGGANRQVDVRRIFDLVVDLPIDERDAALDRECGDDLALRSGVLGLLEALEESVTLASTGAQRPTGAPTSWPAQARPAQVRPAQARPAQA
ncbi:MAG: hypothetical protein AAGF23_20550, partial [Acidobacteriota bacterium]